MPLPSPLPASLSTPEVTKASYQPCFTRLFSLLVMMASFDAMF
jgi:hypothetical protein